MPSKKNRLCTSFYSILIYGMINDVTLSMWFYALYTKTKYIYMSTYDYNLYSRKYKTEISFIDNLIFFIKSLALATIQ